MAELSAASWLLEWRVFPDHIEPRLKGKSAKNAINRKFFTTKEEALAEQRLLRHVLHADNPNFVSSVAAWTPPTPKPPRKSKPGHKG
jgi:hypothetical protein